MMGMPRVRREFRRVIKNLRAVVSAGNLQVKGTTVRVSESGFFVRTQKPFNEGVEVDIALTLPDGTRSKLKGVVKYARRLDVLHLKNGMGIEITERDLPYTQMIDDLRNQQGYV